MSVEVKTRISNVARNTERIERMNEDVLQQLVERAIKTQKLIESEDFSKTGMARTSECLLGMVLELYKEVLDLKKQLANKVS